MQKIAFILLFIFSDTFCADFNLTVGTEGGVRSDSYESIGSTSQTVLFISPTITPLAEVPLKKNLRLDLEGTAEGNFYTEGNSDYSLESQAAFLHTGKKRDLRFILSGGYYSQPGNLDPDQPTEYSQFAFTLEHRDKAVRPLRLSYSLSLLTDSDTSRTDIKNKIKVKKNFKPLAWLLPGIGAGLGMNFSSIKEYGYTEIDFPLSATFLFNDKNYLTGMLYLNMRWYEKTSSSTSGSGTPKITKGKPGKTASGQGTKGSGNSDTPSSQTVTIFVSYTRELSERFDLEFNYDLSLYDSNFGVTYSSSRIYAGLEWHYGTL